MVPRTLVPLCLSLALVSSASAQGSERVTTDWGQVQFNRDKGLTRGVIAGGVDSVWKVLEPMFKDLGLKLTVQDKASGQLGNPRFRAIRRLGKAPVSRYFSCGQGLTGPNADSWHVYIGFGVVFAPAAADKTQFELQMQAEAIDIPDGRNERVPCSTTGLLEYALVNRLNDVFPGTK
jgi:hypothetical protein